MLAAKKRLQEASGKEFLLKTVQMRNLRLMHNVSDFVGVRAVLRVQRTSFSMARALGNTVPLDLVTTCRRFRVKELRFLSEEFLITGACLDPDTNEAELQGLEPLLGGGQLRRVHLTSCRSLPSHCFLGLLQAVPKSPQATIRELHLDHTHVDCSLDLFADHCGASLRVLSLTGCFNMHSSVRGLGCQCLNLESLDIRECQHVTGTTADLAPLKKLRSLAISNSGIGGPLAALSHSANMELFRADELRDLTGSLQDLKLWRKLRHLHLTNCSTMTGLPRALSQAHPHLTTLFLDGSGVAGSVGPLKACTQLKELRLNGTQVNGCLTIFAGFGHLVELRAHATDITMSDEPAKLAALGVLGPHLMTVTLDQEICDETSLAVLRSLLPNTSISRI